MVYVDDIVLIGPDANSLDDFVKQLARKFALRNLESLSYFLAVEVLPTYRVSFSAMTGTKPVPIHIIKDSTLSLDSGTLIDNPAD